MSKRSDKRDTLFEQETHPGGFVFDARVADVFDDMINRSVPGYSTILAMIGVLAERYYQDGSTIYDLGCSLGGASCAMAARLRGRTHRIMAVDNSQAMIDKLSNQLGTEEKKCIELHCRDIRDVAVEDASLVVLNFTLQFIPLNDRAPLLDSIYHGLRPGGLLIISEKFEYPDAKLNDLFVDLYHGFKQAQGYSELEISHKRSALENVLIPESIESHRRRLQAAGFSTFDVWFQCFNFASMVAFK